MDMCVCVCVVVAQLQVLNPRVDLDYIYEGQTLLLPAKTYSERDMAIMRGIADGMVDFLRVFPFLVSCPVLGKVSGMCWACMRRSRKGWNSHVSRPGRRDH